MVPGGADAGGGRRRSTSSRPTRSPDLDVTMVGQAGRARRHGRAAGERRARPADHGDDHRRSPSSRPTRASPAPPAAAPMPQETTGPVVVRRARHAGDLPRSASRPRASRRRSSTQVLDGGARQRAQHRPPRRGDGQHHRDGPLERRRAARQRRGRGHERRHREGGDDADGRQRRHVPHRRPRRRRGRTSLTFTREGFSGQTIALDLGAGERPHRRRRRARPAGPARITGTVDRTPTGSRSAASRSTVTRGDFTRRHGDAHDRRRRAPASAATPSATSRRPGIFAVTFSLAGLRRARRGRSGSWCPAVQSDVSVPMRRADASIVGTVTGGGRPARRRHASSCPTAMTSRTTATASTPNGGYMFTGVAPGSLHADRLGARASPRRSCSSRSSPATPLVRDVALAAGP